MLETVSPALQERLGADATIGLLALLEASKREWGADVTDQAVLRFERRLTEETSLLRLDFARLETSVERALLTQTRWMIGMWVGQIAATAAMIAGFLQTFAR